MSQIFAGDSQVLASATAIVTVAETNGPATNPVRVPFINGKIHVQGVALILTGAGTTGLQLRVRRNIAGDNTVLNPAVQTFTVAAATTVQIGFQFTDAVPDGRDCTYTLSVQQVAAAGNGSFLAGSAISAIVMSG